jgi:hypothetical protein
LIRFDRFGSPVLAESGDPEEEDLGIGEGEGEGEEKGEEKGEGREEARDGDGDRAGEGEGLTGREG